MGIKGQIPWNKGKTNVYTKKALKRMSISRSKFTREKHPRWNGGIRMNNGYITILLPDHPFCNYKGYVKKHRVIMEEHLGRTLLPSEVVHHINGNKLDNRIENLMLFSSSSEHQRHHSINDNRRNKNGTYKSKN